MKKVLFTATVDSHVLLFHLPYLKYFSDLGYEVHVATNGDEEIPYCNKKHKISFERSPYKINNLKAIKKLRKIIEEEKFDIIHTHTPMGSVVTRLAAKRIRKKHNTKVIYTAHGFHFFKGASKLNWIIFYQVEKFLARYTDILITMNMEDYNIAKDKFKTDVRYVHGVGLDEDKFNHMLTNDEKIKLRKSLGLKENDFVMIYPAELSKRKNQEWLINTLYDMLNKNKDIHVLLAGKDSMNKYHETLVKSKNLDNQIHFLGFRKDIPDLISISNIAISTSKQEGLPVNIMEAMYLGLPIVATNCRGNRDLVHNNVNGYLIDQGDSSSFVNSIYDIYNKKVDTSKFSKNSKDMINEYLLKNVMKEMINIYEESITSTSKQ